MNTDFPLHKSHDKATVIIPCYNVEAYILECIESVVLQGDIVHHTYVVDNNSTDDTVGKVLAWKNTHPNFPLTLLSETNPGAPAARNLPLARIETKWIQFLDADDLLLPRKISEQILQFPEADVICAASQHLTIEGIRQLSTPRTTIPIGLMEGEAGNTCANLFSLRSVQSVNGWDESLKSSQEYDLMFRIWQTGATFEVDLTPRAVIRERPSGQISQLDPAAKWTHLVLLRERMLSSFKTDSKVEETISTALYQSFFDQIRNLAKYDLDTALSSYLRILKPIGFSPKRSDATTRAYILCFHVLGFEFTERLKHVLRQ